MTKRKAIKTMKQFKAYAKKVRTHRHFGKGAIFVALFAAIGVGALFVSFAATPTAHFEAERAQLANGALAVGDSGASGGQAIQFGEHNHTPPPPTASCSPGPTISSPGICLDQSTVPIPVLGFSTARRVQELNYGPIKLDDVGAFRTECALSHTSKDDPIVYPGQNDRAHWHQFFGNTAADENLTFPINRGNSTCTGGTLNRTAYWAPALVDTNSYDSATQTFDLARPMAANDSPNPGFPAGGIAMQVYYKAGYNGVMSTDIEWFPPGLRMIAGGNPNVAPTGPPPNPIPSAWGFKPVSFDCIAWGHAQSVWGEQGVDYDTDRIPARCPSGYYIQAKVTFPQCGARHSNGSPVLDTSQDLARYPTNNHRDHMSYPRGFNWPTALGCPDSHPIEYPEILEHFRWRVPAGGAAGLRFSSDMYGNSGAAPGWTFHADWANGWDVATGQTIIDRCYKGTINGSTPGIDCRLNLTGEPHPNGGWWRLD